MLLASSQWVEQNFLPAGAIHVQAMWAHLVGVFDMVSSSSAFSSSFPKRPHSTRSAEPLVKHLSPSTRQPTRRPNDALTKSPDLLRSVIPTRFWVRISVVDCSLKNPRGLVQTFPKAFAPRNLHDCTHTRASSHPWNPHTPWSNTSVQTAPCIYKSRERTSCYQPLEISRCRN
jgi:hypothetical protein